MTSSFDGRLAALAGRPRGRFPAELASALVPSAVLLLLVEVGGTTGLVLTRRARTMRVQAGQISLPGGRIEVGESPEAAAVREAVEELGLEASALEVLGGFDEAWTVAGFVMVPVVARYVGEPAFSPHEGEVDDVLVVPLDHLLDPAHHERIVVMLGDIAYPDDVLTLPAGERVVGVTADLVVDLVAWLGGHDRRRLAARQVGLRWFLERGQADSPR